MLYCALNANGYDKENNKEGMHPVRFKVRGYLMDRSFEKYDFKWNPYQYAKQVLTTNDFKVNKDTNPDFVGAINYLARFRLEAEVDQIWPMVKKETEKELKRYNKAAIKLLDEYRQIVGLPQPAGDVVLTVNLLESYFRGFSITVGETSYLIVGPSDKPNLRNLLHELLHTTIREARFDRDVDMSVYSRIPEDLRQNYPKEKIVEESLVRSLVVYLSGRLGIEKQRFSNQDMELVFPGIFLNKLESFKPVQITSEVIEKVVNE